MEYGIQRIIDLLGSASSPTTLVASYDNTDAAVATIKGCHSATLYVYYTMGTGESSNSIQVKLSFAETDLAVDSPLWAPDQVQSTTTGSTSFTDREYTYSSPTAAGTYSCFRIPLSSLTDGAIKIQVKETGKATNFGTCYMRLVTNTR